MFVPSPLTLALIVLYLKSPFACSRDICYFKLSLKLTRMPSASPGVANNFQLLFKSFTFCLIDYIFGILLLFIESSSQASFEILNLHFTYIHKLILSMSSSVNSWILSVNTKSSSTS